MWYEVHRTSDALVSATSQWMKRRSTKMSGLVSVHDCLVTSRIPVAMLYGFIVFTPLHMKDYSLQRQPAKRAEHEAVVQAL